MRLKGRLENGAHYAAASLAACREPWRRSQRCALRTAASAEQLRAAIAAWDFEAEPALQEAQERLRAFEAVAPTAAAGAPSIGVVTPGGASIVATRGRRRRADDDGDGAAAARSANERDDGAATAAVNRGRRSDGAAASPDGALPRPRADEIVVHLRSGDRSRRFQYWGIGHLPAVDAYGRLICRVAAETRAARVTIIAASEFENVDALAAVRDDVDDVCHVVATRARLPCARGPPGLSADADLAYMAQAPFLVVHFGGFSAAAAVVARGRVAVRRLGRLGEARDHVAEREQRL